MGDRRQRSSVALTRPAPRDIQTGFQVDQESTTYTDQVVLDQHIQVLDQHIQLLFQVDQALRSSRR